MEKQDHIKYWLESSEHDLHSMRNNFQSKNYDWALFIGHLAVEKILKALWVKNNETNHPPKTHNLVKIASETSFHPDENETVLLNRINSFNLETRYPDYKFNFYKLCTKEFTEEHIKKIEDLIKCITTMI